MLTPGRSSRGGCTVRASGQRRPCPAAVGVRRHAGAGGGWPGSGWRGWQRCAEHGEPLAVVMADVDHFKQFNDNHGHQAGDQQLRRVAGVLAAEVSGVDELAARYGGEEFVLILPGIDRAAAMQRAERVRRQAEAAMAAAGLPGSISLGVAVTVPAAGGDPALYRAKHGGRNRVECAGGDDLAVLAQAGVIAAETVARPPQPTLSSAP
ncbi:GGDEF domain-containing protein [Stenotrophomonas sp. PS02297]|uniref:GGDEF domain-containing protein n=1 Tax=Stenotrophomonas sp. PS02297 TaxID=2991423 RepID=UPI00249AC30C|nr:GGDEF domain-containing protein [Stenotrophomonas sp. PS02297]